MAIYPISRRPECVEKVSEWHYQEWKHLYPSMREEDFRRDIRDSLDVGLVPGTWVLEKDRQIVGSASLVANEAEALSPWLVNVFIREDYRGRGLGRFMVQKVLEQLAGSELRQLLLYTEDRREFYASLGWSVVSSEAYQNRLLHLMCYSFD